MDFQYATIWPQFFTASFIQKKHLLIKDEYKNIIIDTLKFLVHNNRINLLAFCIMSNHVHIIWQPLQQFTLTKIQSSFSSHTAKSIIKKLAIENPKVLESLKVNKYDRLYQVWKREPLSIELFTSKVFIQKMDYIHFNPVKAGICKLSEEYKYSSAKFYETGVDDFNMISHYSGGYPA